MSKMDPKAVREWKAGYDDHNRWVLEERRKATYQERFKSLCANRRQAEFLGHLEPAETGFVASFGVEGAR